MDDAQLQELSAAHPELAELYHEALAGLAAAADEAALEDVRVRFLGRKSRLTEILRSIPQLAPEVRPVVGRYGNQVRA
jgi:phenylalanyl-tRNA synthetase alpha chain